MKRKRNNIINLENYQNVDSIDDEIINKEKSNQVINAINKLKYPYNICIVHYRVQN